MITSTRVAGVDPTGDHATVATIAERAGYRSEAAFSRAFKRLTAQAPGAARRAARSQVQIAQGGAP